VEHCLTGVAGRAGSDGRRQRLRLITRRAFVVAAKCQLPGTYRNYSAMGTIICFYRAIWPPTLMRMWIRRIAKDGTDPSSAGGACNSESSRKWGRGVRPVR